MSAPASVWVVVEEAETGTLADGNPYCIHSIHSTEEAAAEAVAQWRDSHGAGHAFVGDGHWCVECGSACDYDEFTVDRVCA